MLAAGLLAACATPGADAPIDPMAPTTSRADALVGPLEQVTIVVEDMAEADRFFADGLGMKRRDVAATSLAAYGIDASTVDAVAVFSRPNSPETATVRVVDARGERPSSRPGVESRFTGPLGAGFGGSDIPAVLEAVEEAGFRSTAGVQNMDFPRADGSTYEIGEVHFLAPADMLVLGVSRGEETPVGPLDPATDLSGIAYSSYLTGDLPAMEVFLGDVLGLEKRRDITFNSSGPGGGMVGLVAGEEVVFQQWFSPGARSGYLVVMTRLDQPSEPAPVAPDLRSEGLSLWTFGTDDLAEIRRRAERAGTPVREIPGGLVLTTPDGFPVEVKG